MAYLDKQDYTISSSIEDLNRYLTAAAQDSTKTQDEIRLEAELTAQAVIQSYTKSVYDIATEFAKVAPDATRARLVIKCNVDISIFYICQTINPRNVPSRVMEAYERCIENLEAVRRGELALIGVPEYPEDDETKIVHTVITSQRKFISKPHQDQSIIQ